MGLGKEISQFSQVLQFEGSVDSLVWKNPIEDFNTTSVLVVDETHEALLVVNGNACDLFGPGRHVLETPNIPLVKRIINIPTDGQTSFPCKVFFINKVHQMDLTWGIPGEITLNDPVYDIFLHVGMCGNMNFLINDSRKFMLKMVGFRDAFDAESMVSKFRGIIKQYVKSYISKIMNVGKVSYFDMNENLFEISEVVKEQLRPLFEDYGIDVLQFNIESITVPDEDLIVAFLDMVENHKMVVENSGLLTVAALKHLDVKGKKIVSILSGGNMDVITMSSVVQQGLIMRDRIFTVSVLLPDKPGELCKVADTIAQEQGNVVKLEHNQFVTTNRTAQVELRITMESFGTDHKNKIISALERNGYKPKVVQANL